MTFDEWADGKPVWEMDAKAIWDAAQNAERDACVQLCLKERRNAFLSPEHRDGLQQAADAIRARSNAGVRGEERAAG